MPLLKCKIRPKNLDNISCSSISAVTAYNEFNISTKIYIIYENIVTPNNNIKATKSRSKSLIGAMSPNPTVDNDVKAK